MPASALVAMLLSLAWAGCIWDPSGLSPPGASDGAVSDSSTDAAPDADGSAQCGNGRVDPGEACDGPDLAGQQCTDFGYTGGTLACTTGCLLDFRGCEGESICGDGVLGPQEDCDGSSFGGATCQSETPFLHGSLQCTQQCTVDTSGCHTCGDGMVQGPEACDGGPGTATCESLGYSGGTLLCGEDCRLDEGGCYTCGDGICQADSGESYLSCPQDCRWVSISAGQWHTCGIRADHTLWCWGRNDLGQLGLGVTGADESSPQLVSGPGPSPGSLAAVIAVSAGNDFTCALAQDGSLWCWGQNDYGQLGADPNVTSESPVALQVPGLTGVAVRTVAAGGTHVCLLTGQGEIWCWGRNDKGQLGDNGTTDRHTPGPISTATGLTAATAITAGAKHTCAIDAAHSAWCWGDKGSGRLGDGTNTDQDEPVRVDITSGLTSVVDISAGTNHTCAVHTDGSPFCWGNKGDGRLGDGSNSDQAIPARVDTTTGLSAARAIAAGEAHTCAIRPDGLPWCWGKNADGQLGDGGTAAQALPVAVSNGTGLLAASLMDAGSFHTCAIDPDGDLWCWGDNADGQVGDGTQDDVLEPAPVPDP